MDIILTLSILIMAILMLGSGICRADLAGIFIVCMLLATGQIDEKTALAGFSDQAVIVIGCMFIVAAALKRSGLIETALNYIGQFNLPPRGLLLALLAMGALVSGFVSNNVTMLIFLPMILALDLRQPGAARPILLPVAFMIQIAGNMTLTGSSNNLLVNSLRQSAGRGSFSFFELAPVALILCGCAAVFFLFLNRVLNFPRARPINNEPDTSEFLFEVVISESSPWLSETLKNVYKDSNSEFKLIQINRQGQRLDLLLDAPFESGDILLIRGRQTSIMTARSRGIFELRPVVKFGSRLQGSNYGNTVRAVIPAGSHFEHKTLAKIKFQQNFHGLVLAIRRGDDVFAEGLGSITLLSGDELIVLGDETFRSHFEANNDLILVENSEFHWPNRKAAIISLTALALPIVLSGLDIMGLGAACLLSVLLIFAFGILKSDEAYAALDPKLLVFIAAMISLSKAIEASGLPQLLIHHTTETFYITNPLVMLLMVMLITSVLTELISNAAASAITVPLALSISQQLSISSDPLLAGVIIAASTSFVIPFGDQFNMLAFYTGKYRWKDFLLLGIPLKLVLLLVSWLLIPAFWPF